ncbi:MAG: sensor histidine kinase, partial [Oscillospiraceae bacterium]|nr:sensor histidine kinase [Oscillospiraceae bacterium]
MKLNLFGASGIKRRWMLNNVLVFAVIVAIAVITYAVTISGYYYDSMQRGLETKAKIAANFFAAYTTRSSAEYYDRIYKYTNEFDSASTIELQFINTNGRVQVSSYGLS